MVTFKDLEMGLALATSVDHDPFRELLGLNPTNAVISMMVDVSYMVGGKEGDRVLR